MRRQVATEKASRKEGDETHGEEIGHHRAAALGGVGLLGALLGQEGGILGSDPAAMDFVAQQDAGEPGLQLALQPTVRKTVKPREGTYAQCIAPTPHVLAQMFFQGRAPHSSNVPQRAEMRYTLSCRYSSLI